MTPTSDERREVAARLRVYSHDFDFGDSNPFWYVAKAAFGDVDARTYYSVFARLADLIDPCPIDGETSDGYHTFNELYHHRAVLFSVIVAKFRDRAWKSKLHADGTMYDGMFIVGIETPDGQATYHYDVDPYWDLFRCKVLDRAPEWDGHTPDQAIERIGKLADLINLPTCHVFTVDGLFVCDRCRAVLLGMKAKPNFCPHCGAMVVSDDD